MRFESPQFASAISLVTAALLLCAGGCMGPISWHNPLPEIENAPVYATPRDPEELDRSQSSPGQESLAGLENQDIPADVMANLESIGKTHPEEVQNLLSDREKLKPAIWAGIVKHRRGSIDFKHQEQERNNTQGGIETQLVTVEKTSTVTQPGDSDSNYSPRGGPVSKPGTATAAHEGAGPVQYSEQAVRYPEQAVQYSEQAVPQSAQANRHITEEASRIRIVPSPRTIQPVPIQSVPSQTATEPPYGSATQAASNQPAVVEQRSHQFANRPAGQEQARNQTAAINPYDTPEGRSAIAKTYSRMPLNLQMQMSGNPLNGKEKSGGFTQSPQMQLLAMQYPGMQMPGMQMQGMQSPSILPPNIMAAMTQQANAAGVVPGGPAVSANQTPQDHLESTIKALEKKIEESPASVDTTKEQTSLRLLYLAAGQTNDAMRPLMDVSPAEQGYWANQMYGLSIFVDKQQFGDSKHRAAEIKRHLTAASAKLGEIGALTLNNLYLCSKVTSFGIYEPYDPAEFLSGDRFLLYAEVENFRSEPGDKGFHTTLKGSYQILDSRGNKLAGGETPIIDDYCQTVRRDFFLLYRIQLPTEIPVGKYTLQLVVEDTKSQKVGQSSVDLKIRSSGKK